MPYAVSMHEYCYLPLLRACCQSLGICARALVVCGPTADFDAIALSVISVMDRSISIITSLYICLRYSSLCAHCSTHVRLSVQFSSVSYYCTIQLDALMVKLCAYDLVWHTPCALVRRLLGRQRVDTRQKSIVNAENNANNGEYRI